MTDSCYHYEQYYRKISTYIWMVFISFTFLFVFENFFCNIIWICVLGYLLKMKSVRECYLQCTGYFTK